MKFENENVGKKLRSVLKSKYPVQIQNGYTPIQRICRSFQITQQSYSQVVRRQFPIQFAAGRTIHRMQGLALMNGVVALPTKWACPHMHYVALSRYTKIEDVKILGEMPYSTITLCSKVQKEMQRMRAERMFENSTRTKHIRFKLDMERYFTIMLHNIVSHVYTETMLSYVHTQFDLLPNVCILTECNAVCRTTYHMSKYNAIHAPNNAQVTHLVKKEMQYTILTQTKTVCALILHCIPAIRVIGCYCPPIQIQEKHIDSTIVEVQTILLHSFDGNTIVAGDFNYEMHDKTWYKTAWRRILTPTLECWKTGQTTLYGSAIDHIWTTKGLSKTGVEMHAPWSDHNMLFLACK